MCWRRTLCLATAALLVGLAVEAACTVAVAVVRLVLQRLPDVLSAQIPWTLDSNPTPM